MTQREHLPHRRLCEIVSIETSNGLAYTATFSKFADGRLAEVFLSIIRVDLQPMSRHAIARSSRRWLCNSAAISKH